MNKQIQPTVNTDCVVTCACGNTFNTLSTLKQIKVDICSACHPFYTGQQKFVDTEGRIDKFNKKAKLMQQKLEAAKKAKANKSKKQETPSTPEKQPTLKELFSKTQ